MLEASSSQTRLQWLQALQRSRRRHFENAESSDVSPSSVRLLFGIFLFKIATRDITERSLSNNFAKNNN